MALYLKLSSWLASDLDRRHGTFPNNKTNKIDYRYTNLKLVPYVLQKLFKVIMVLGFNN